MSAPPAVMVKLDPLPDALPAIAGFPMSWSDHTPSGELPGCASTASPLLPTTRLAAAASSRAGHIRRTRVLIRRHFLARRSAGSSGAAQESCPECDEDLYQRNEGDFRGARGKHRYGMCDGRVTIALTWDRHLPKMAALFP